MVNSGLQDPKTTWNAFKTRETSQHQNWPRHMDCPQIGPKSAIELGKKLQKDKRYLFRAPTPPPQTGGRGLKQAGFGKLAFLQQNGAFFGPRKKHDFGPFRATFSVKILVHSCATNGLLACLVLWGMSCENGTPICQIVPVSSASLKTRKCAQFVSLLKT